MQTVKTKVPRRKHLRSTRPTLVDVARAAAVSTASASRALSRPTAVSDEIKARVSKAADALGYVANGAARSLVRSRSGLIGAVLGTGDEPHLGLLLGGLAARLSDAGWTVILGVSGETDAPLDAVRRLVGQGVEALVFVGMPVPSDLASMRGLDGVPCLGVDGTGIGGFAVGGGAELTRGINLAAEYLRQLGHRHMAAVVEPDSSLGNLLVETLLADRGSPHSSIHIVTVGDGLLAESVANWRSVTHPLTAAICSNGAIALALVRACACAGLDVPGDISVVSLGDTALARWVTPALTSLRIPARRAGIAAAEHLIATLAGRQPETLAVPVKLVIRGSTAPPPSARHPWAR